MEKGAGKQNSHPIMSERNGQFFAPIPIFFGDYFYTLAQAITGATLAKNIPKSRSKSRNRCVLMIPILFYHFSQK